MTAKHVDAHERHLIELACAGDSDAFEKLIEPYEKPLQITAFTMLKSEHSVADAYQRTLLAAWKYLNTFKGNSTFKTWITRILINECKKILKNSSINSVPLDENANLAIEDNNELNAEFKSMLSILDEKYHSVTYLHYGLGFSAKEIGDILGISTTAVTTRLARARTLLKRHLSNQEKGDAV